MSNQNIKVALVLPTALFLFALIALKAPQSVFSAVTHLVISEVKIGSEVSPTDEFIEIYNPSLNTVDVSGWMLTKKTAAADATEAAELITLPENTEIAPQSYYLLAHTNYNGTPSADLSYAGDSISNNNTIYLKDEMGTVVDKLGLGSTNDAEGEAKPNPATGSSVERKAKSTSTSSTMTTGVDMLEGNGEDTDDNIADFFNRTNPDPQNSSSSAEPAMMTPSPSASESATPSISPTASASATPTASASATPTSSPTMTPSPSASASATPSVSPTASPSATPIPSMSPTSTPSATPTMTPSASASATPSATPTASPTPMPVPQPSVIASFPLFNGRAQVCILSYTPMKFGFFSFYMPNVNCSIVSAQ